MKSTIFSMIVVLVIMAIVPMFFIRDGNISDILGIGGFGAKEEEQVKLPQNYKPVVTNKKVEVYTWVDEHGVKQYSSAPPSEGGDSEKVVLSPDQNVVDAFKVPEQEEEKESGPRVFSLSNPYTPGGVKELVDNTKDVTESMNEQAAEREKMMQDLFGQQKK